MRGDRLARFVGEHGSTLIVLTILCGVAIGVNCGREKDTPTIPDPVAEAVATPAPAEAEPVVVEPTPTPEGGRGSNPGPTSAVIAGNCSATLTNIGQAPHGVNIRYTAPLNESIVYLSRDVVVPAKGTAQVSAAQAYFEGHYQWGEEECDFRLEIQCDFTAGSGEHLGGKFTRIAIHNPQCDECVEEPTIQTGPWGECNQVLTASDHDDNGSCSRSRTITTTFCDEGEQKRVEVEPCLCPTPPPCVDTPGGDVSVNASGNPLLAAAAFSDSGEWRLRILAASRESECENDDPDFVKRNVRKTLECDETGTLATSYSWHGHGSDWWWATLKRNGSLVDRTACLRNPTD